MHLTAVVVTTLAGVLAAVATALPGAQERAREALVPVRVKRRRG